GNFLFVGVGDRRALVDLPKSIYGAGVEQRGRGQLSLSGAAVSDERHVPDVRRIIDLHNTMSSDGIGSKGRSYSKAGARNYPRVLGYGFSEQHSERPADRPNRSSVRHRRQ